MISHIIHYIWFGNNSLSSLAEQCLASWQVHMPDWQYMRWDESNFDIAAAPLYVRQAYEAKKYAFVSDYVRLWALEKYGGVYMDTDVEVIKSFNPLLSDAAFIGFEESNVHLSGTCVMGCEPHCRWVQDMLALYNDISFVKPDGSFDMTTNVQRMGEIMLKELKNERMREFWEVGVKDWKYWEKNQYIEKWGLRIYTHDYFSPITSTRVMQRTNNTYSIHYFAGSWRDYTRWQSFKRWIVEHILGRKLVDKFVQVKRKLRV